MRARCLLVTAALLCIGVVPETPAFAYIQEVGGYQSGTYLFRQALRYRITGAYATLRLTFPTAYQTRGSNLFYQDHADFDVRNTNGSPAQFEIADIYNVRETNSGIWYYVDNPSPGNPYEFDVVYEVQNQSWANANAQSSDVPVFGYDTNGYTMPDYFADSNNPVIEDALEDALASYGTAVQSGTRGNLERIALAINDHCTFGTKAASTSLSRASQVWTSAFGDCDDLVKVTVALQRLHGIASRCVLSGSLGDAVNGLYAASTPVLHAFGEYWNGDDRWECFEASRITNFALASQVVIGADVTYENLYPAEDINFPADLISTSQAGTMSTGNSSAFNYYDLRDVGSTSSSKLLYAQIFADQRQMLQSEPFDVLEEPGTGVDVPVVSELPSGIGVVLARQPSLGSIRFDVSMANAGRVRLALWDVAGRCVSRIGEEIMAPGVRRIEHMNTALAPGIYFVTAECGTERVSARVVFMP